MLRIGNSFDIHQRVENRPLILGGIKISKNNGLLGHSDADVLTHVITESLMGALGIGDLGKLFPDTDIKFKNISSIDLLIEVKKILDKEQYSICNIDTQLILNTPMLSKFKPLMVEKIASVLNIDLNQINIKATRSENSITAINNDKAVYAFATCLIERKN